MKKLAFLLSMVVLAACGGGDNKVASTSGSSGGIANPGVTKTFTITINDKQSAKLFYNISTPVKADLVRRRVVVTNKLLDDASQGMTFKQSVDYIKGKGSTITFALPYKDGYTFEFVEYYATPSGFTTYTTAEATPTGGGVYSTTSTTPTTNVITYARADNVSVNDSVSGLTLTPKPVELPTISFPVTALKITSGAFAGYSGIPAKSESNNFYVERAFANYTASAKTTYSKPTMFNNVWNLIVRKRTAGLSPADTYTFFNQQGTTSRIAVPAVTVYENGKYELRAFADYYLSSSILIDKEPFNKFYIRGVSNYKGDATKFTPVVLRIATTPGITP